jgi:hypothetical protein
MDERVVLATVPPRNGTALDLRRLALAVVLHARPRDASR